MSAALTLGLPQRSAAQLVVDCDGDTPHPEGAYIEQLGQKLDNNGDEHPEIIAYTQGMFPEVYALDDSRVAFVFPVSTADPVTGAVDLAKVWCEPTGEGARQRTPVGKGVVSTRYNFLDKRLSEPVENVAAFVQELYEDVWENIDLVLASNGSGPVLYIVCKVGSDPADVRLQFHGQDSLKFVDGEMTIYKQERWIRLREATAYQVDENDDVSAILNWTGDWEENNNGGVASLTFDEYDPSQILVFKVAYPQMPPPPPTDSPEWCTYFASQTSNDFVTGEYALADGGLYLCGHAGINDFPADAFTQAPAPNQQGYFTKFDSDHHKTFSFYFGPSARCITVVETGEDELIYVAGGLANNDNLFCQERDPGDPDDYFHPSTTGSLDRSWVACFRYGGSGANDVHLVWSTHFRAEEITSMVMRSNGELWMTGMASTELEQVSGGWTQPVNYDRSAFIARFDADSHLLWCSWIGGGGKDWGLDIALNEGVDRVVVVGQTNSNAYEDNTCEIGSEPPFPLYDGGHWFYCACGGYNCNSAPDGFIALFDLGGQRQTVSYFGGHGSTASSVDFDPQGNIYVAGHITDNHYTTGTCQEPSATNTGFPHCQTAGWFDVSSSTASSAHYLARFSPDLELEWSTVLNASGDFQGISQLIYPTIGKGLNLPQVDVDEAGAVYFAGSTLSGSADNTAEPFPLQSENGLYFTDENQDAGYYLGPPYYTTGQEIYVVKLSPQGAPLWGTYFGGRGTTVQSDYYQGGGDLLCELKVRNDQVYIGGCTNSFNSFPFAFTPPAYFSGLPPDPSVVDGPNVWNGFIANLSDLFNQDVAVEPVNANAAGISVFPSPAEGTLTVPLNAISVGNENLMVFDATGRLVLRMDELRPAGDRLMINVAILAPGVYSGRVTGRVSQRFNFVKR